MANVTIHLQSETERRLAEKAEQGGQTLETYLEQLVERQVRTGDGIVAGRETDEEEALDRPWRGVFVPPRPRHVLFSRELSLQADQLTRRQPSLNMSWHRVATDDE